MSILEVALFLAFVPIVTFTYVNNNQALDNTVMYFIIILLSSASAFQYFIMDPVDYGQYKIIFNSYPDSFSSIYTQGHELGFNFLNWLFKLLNFSFESLIFFIVLILFYGVVQVSKLFNKDKLLIFLSIITLVVFFNLFSNLYRQAIATSIVLIALARNRSIVRQFAMVLLATMFHVSAIIIFPYFIVQNRKSPVFLIAIMTLSLLLFFIGIDDVIFYVISLMSSFTDNISYSSFARVELNALSSDKVQYAYRSYYFLSIFLIVLFVFNHKKGVEKIKHVSSEIQWRLVNFLAYGVMIYSATYSIGAFSRLGIYFYIIFPIVLFLVSRLFFNYSAAKILLACFSCFSLFGLFLVKNIYLT